jgi:hypothetical protein
MKTVSRETIRAVDEAERALAAVKESLRGGDFPRSVDELERRVYKLRCLANIFRLETNQGMKK